MTRNGDGLVYNVSDCGRPQVKMFAFGGAFGGAFGERHVCGKFLTDRDSYIVWTKLPTALLSDPNIKEKNPPYDYNWRLDDFIFENYIHT